MYLVWRCCCLESFVFFFSSRRRHTRCGRDWSSDVCSSDLGGGPVRRDGGRHAERVGRECGHRLRLGGLCVQRPPRVLRAQIGRASCRERVESSVVVVWLKKKKTVSRYVA